MSDKTDKRTELQIYAVEPKRLHVLHRDGEGRERAGTLAPLEHGKAIQPGGKVVHVERDPGRPGVLHMVEIPDSPKVQALPAPESPAPVRTGKGPAKVTSDDYRAGWGRIFGGEPPVGVS